MNTEQDTSDDHSKGTIGVVIEEHFDASEYRAFNDFFPTNGYRVEYLTHLWGNPALTFRSNPEAGAADEYVTVTKELADVEPSDYRAVILIGGYAMDRLRYQAKPVEGAANEAPAVAFLRKVCADDRIKIGTICHSLWLFCADPSLIGGRRVTCAHNVICDLVNAGANVVFNGDKTADLVVDGNLISASHPSVVDRFLETLLRAIEDSGVEEVKAA